MHTKFWCSENLKGRGHFGDRGVGGRMRKEGGRVVRDNIFNGGNRDKFLVMKVPRQYPLVLLVKEG
jgi:hypothetical protein